MLIFSLSTCRGQTRKTLVATINLQQAIFDSNEGKKEVAAIRTKVPQERQQKIQQIAHDILVKMAPLISKFAEDNGLGVVAETSRQWDANPVFWAKQHGGDILHTQVDITKRIVDSYNGAAVHLPPVNGDQSVVAINIERVVFNTDEGKRELAAISGNVTPEQRQKISQGILVKMVPLIAKLAGDSGVDIVIDVSPPWPKGSIVFSDPRLDITERVVSAYNGR